MTDLVASDAPTPPDPDVPDDAVEDTVTDTAVVPVEAAARSIPITAVRDRPPAALTIDDVARLYIQSRSGPTVQAQRARQMLQTALPRLSVEGAAFTNVTMVGANNVGPGGAAFPELVDVVSHGDPADRRHLPRDARRRRLPEQGVEHLDPGPDRCRAGHREIGHQ